MSRPRSYAIRHMLYQNGWTSYSCIKALLNKDKESGTTNCFDRIIGKLKIENGRAVHGKEMV